VGLKIKDDKIQDLEEQVIIFIFGHPSYPVLTIDKADGSANLDYHFYISMHVQLRDLMMSLEAGKKVEQQLSIPNELKDGTVLPISVESSSGKGPKGRKKANNPRES
jgi:hypothetical protein